MTKCVIPTCKRNASRDLQWDNHSALLCAIHYREVLTIHNTTMAPYDYILDHMGVPEPDEPTGAIGATGASGQHV